MSNTLSYTPLASTSAHLYELNAIREVLDQIRHRFQVRSFELGIEPFGNSAVSDG